MNNKQAEFLDHSMKSSVIWYRDNDDYITRVKSVQKEDEDFDWLIRLSDGNDVELSNCEIWDFFRMVPL